MIKALEKLIKAKANYNYKTGEGANDLLLALLDYREKERIVDEALVRVNRIYGR